MDAALLADMAAAGVRAEPLSAGDVTAALPLDAFVRVYAELHADKFDGEVFCVN